MNAPPLSSSSWVKYEANPVLGGDLGTCFDMSVDKANGQYRMWFSWRPKQGIGYAESDDGLHWRVREELVLGPWDDGSADAQEVTRPFVLVEEDGLTMWYATHEPSQVVISCATSSDGLAWDPKGPVLRPQRPWEKTAVMCPSVLRDNEGLYHMWYSGGERYEPDAIGYATSPDGRTWARVLDGPVLRPGLAGSWESDRVAGAHVFRVDDFLYAAYIGFANGFEESSIGVARSRDGINWARHSLNPIITKGAPGEFDSINVYKPFVIVDGDVWRLWYNGSSPAYGPDPRPENRIEQIGYTSSRFRFSDPEAGTARP